MKNLFICLLVLCSIVDAVGQNTSPMKNMKLNAGFITEKIEETKTFYTEILGFSITFENDFYLLLNTPNHSAHLSFLLPNHPTQQPIFQPAYVGYGAYLTIEVDDVDAVYRMVQEKHIEISIPIRDEPWGDRHFAIVDPNGLGIDIVTYSKPTD